MTRRTETIAADYFDGLYTQSPDPWRFRTSDYERDKYAATLAGLSRPRYSTALEVGCSIGVFTAMLAPRCGTLTALDASAVALRQAEAACAGFPSVSFVLGAAPDAMPSGPFDLIVLSEVLYYLDRADLARMADVCIRRLADGGEILTCHWLGETDYPLTGAEAADLFAGHVARRLRSRTRLADGDYRLERLTGGSRRDAAPQAEPEPG